jgi:hypothetical protein
MDPAKKRKRSHAEAAPTSEQSHPASPPTTFGEVTDADREKDLAEAESKNLWDATEVIDMDKV